MSIELCLIVKNSGNKIIAALESWKPIIDYWTILDTGSTDGTPEVIRKTLHDIDGQLFIEDSSNFPFDCFGDEKLQKAIIKKFGCLPFDFAKGRNRSLDLCKKHCDFIITIDDTYIIKNPKMLKQKLNHAKPKGYNAFLINIENGTIKLDQFGIKQEVRMETNIESLRIIRSSKLTETKLEGSYKWLNSIHEVLGINDDTPINITLNHDTYIYDEVDDYHNERSTERHKRDIHVLEICYNHTTEEKLKARYAYYAAQTSIILHDNALAELWLKRRIDAAGPPCQDLYCVLNQYARLMNKRSYAEQAIEMYSNKIEGYFEAAQLAYRNKLYNVAYSYLRHGLFNFSNEVMFHETYLDFLKLIIKLALRFSHNADAVNYLNKALSITKFDSYINQNVELCKDLGIWKEVEEKKSEPQYQEITISTRAIKRLVFITGPCITGPWDAESTNVRGSETSILKLVPLLTSKYEVLVFCETPYKGSKTINGVIWSHINNLISYIEKNDIDYMVCVRTSNYLKLMNQHVKTIRNHYFWAHDTCSSDALCPSRIAFRKFIFLSEFHKAGYIEQYGLPDVLCEIIPNGFDVSWVQSQKWPDKVPNKFIYSSDANRGLYELLVIFPQIKKRMPDATLDIYCDLDNTDVVCFSGEYRDQCLKKLDYIKRIVKEFKYITVHGRKPKYDLYCGFALAEYWIYPNTFVETFCITALEAQYFKCKIICPKLGALTEVVKSGVLYDIDSNNINEIILNNLFDKKTKWKLDEGYEHVVNHAYEKIATRWIKMFDGT